jgi:hypothetical protein
MHGAKVKIVIKYILVLSNGAMCQTITPSEPLSYTDCTFRRRLSGVCSSRSVVSDPLHLHEVIRGLSVGEVSFLTLYCDIVLLRDFLDSSLCTAATMVTLLAGILRSVDSLYILVS